MVPNKEINCYSDIRKLMHLITLFFLHLASA